MYFYGVGQGSLDVSDHFVSSVEITEHQQQNGNNRSIEEWFSGPDFFLVANPNISIHASGCIAVVLLLAVISAYFLIGNSFMKLRLNIETLFIDDYYYKAQQLEL